MRRRAVLVVEYGKENGRPLITLDWEKALGTISVVQYQGPVVVQVQEDEPA